MVPSSYRAAALCVLLALLVIVQDVQRAAATPDRKGREQIPVRQHDDEIVALSYFPGQNAAYGVPMPMRMQTVSDGDAFSVGSQHAQAVPTGRASVLLSWQHNLRSLVPPGRQTLEAPPPSGAAASSSQNPVPAAEANASPPAGKEGAGSLPKVNPPAQEHSISKAPGSSPARALRSGGGQYGTTPAPSPPPQGDGSTIQPEKSSSVPAGPSNTGATSTSPLNKETQGVSPAPKKPSPSPPAVQNSPLPGTGDSKADKHSRCHVNATEEPLTSPNQNQVVLSTNMSGTPLPPPVPEPMPAGNGPNPGVIAGAVIGAVGGVALLGLLAGLLVHCRHRRYLNEYKYPITEGPSAGTVGPLTGKLRASPTNPGSGKDVLFDRDQGPSNNMKAHRSAAHGMNGYTGVAAGDAADAGAMSTVVDVGALMDGAAVARGAMVPGFTGDELQAGLSELKHTVTNRLLTAVNNSQLEIDVVAAWLDAGMDTVRGVLPVSKSDYMASHSFVEDWRTHRAWDWLNSYFWMKIPTNEQVLAVQDSAQVMASKTQYARHVLGLISRDPSLPAFKSAAQEAAHMLLREAAMHAHRSGVSVSVGIRKAAAGHYRPVLVQLCGEALKFHLQVQGTSDTLRVFVPGATDWLSVDVPQDGLVCKSRMGGVEPRVLCERPGILGRRSANMPGADVWVPADAVNITPLELSGHQHPHTEIVGPGYTATASGSLAQCGGEESTCVDLV